MPETSEEDRAKRVPSIIPIEFWEDHEENNGQLIPYDFVRWVKKENPGQGSTDKVMRVEKQNPAVWGVIKPYYEAWKKGHTVPDGSTSLDVVPFITKRMAQQLRMLYLMSVEDLAGCTDAGLDRIGMGARELREKARAYVKIKNGDGKTAGQMAEQNKKIEDLQAQVQQLIKDNAELGSKLPKRQKPGAFKDEKEAA